MTAIPIVLAMPRMGVGGTPRHVLEILAGIDRTRFAPALYCMKTWPASPFLSRVRELDIEVIDGAVGETFTGFRWMRPVLQLARELRRRRTGVVHSFLFHANCLAPMAARLARVPAVIASKRSLDTYPARADRMANRVGNALAHAITVPAESVRRHVHLTEGCRLEKIITVPNGIDVRRVDAAPDVPRASSRHAIVGTVGRLAPKKAQADLLRAAAIVVRRAPETEFWLVGDGPFRSALEDLARELGIGATVRFFGARDDVESLLRAMDVFVLPSHIEGMSNSLLEAMAARRAVVATDVGGNPEVIVGETGVLVPPQNPAEMADAILTLLKDPARRHAMGAAARSRIEERFTVGTMVRRLERLYGELLTGRAHA